MSENSNPVRDEVRARYASAALSVTNEGRRSLLSAAPDVTCCGGDATASATDTATGCCAPTAIDESLVFGSALYDDASTQDLPGAALLASLGCGNPTAVADLQAGETVLDLGSGGGIDVLLSARRVGPTGFAYGLDMTDEMLDLARHNAVAAQAQNVQFLKGTIEEIPLGSGSVDVVISNCVINLSTDKPAVIGEMFRVLRPGGRVGVSDVVAENHLAPAQRAERGSHVGCIAGALSITEYESLLAAAGFEQVSVTLTHEVTDGMHGAIVRAVKPASAA
ncbi:arsenite methyltransferase [Cryobacterium sp. TMT2-18-3]|uniref:arsenite methyltransferase n=1 Tax=unclassified Cryobacterium TaxID=2649013 RepID=UPI00106B7A4E|nr:MULTISPECIES: arsenite methyltransferase [unclassified Cryobacterium]TFC31856.1 arsenite methyltransferase [Cryobacterium sp. TMT2-18-2]TFC58824.1 arsenite methyltransferase [Cryobacterium sp. TMT2-15-1]TFC64860.1 arsenite methyltransferase [Cryobacterium sp. TMT2-18-3]